MTLFCEDRHKFQAHRIVLAPSSLQHLNYHTHNQHNTHPITTQVVCTVSCDTNWCGHKRPLAPVAHYHHHNHHKHHFKHHFNNHKHHKHTCAMEPR